MAASLKILGDVADGTSGLTSVQVTVPNSGGGSLIAFIVPVGSTGSAPSQASFNAAAQAFADSLNTGGSVSLVS